MPDSLVSIGEYAFMDCKALKKVTFPKNIVSIGQTAFEACNNLKSICINAANPPSTWFENFSSDVNKRATLFVPKESVALYKSTATWKLFRNIQAID